MLNKWMDLRIYLIYNFIYYYELMEENVYLGFSKSNFI